MSTTHDSFAEISKIVHKIIKQGKLIYWEFYYPKRLLRIQNSRINYFSLFYYFVHNLAYFGEEVIRSAHDIHVDEEKNFIYLIINLFIIISR